MTRAVFLFIFWASSALSQPLGPLPVQDHAGWQAIGRVNIAGYKSRSMCSGTLVAPDQVLTAAHCVMRPDGTVFQLTDMTFVAGWLRGDYAEAGKPAHVRIHPKAYQGDRFNPAYDLALVTLLAPLAIAPIPAQPADTAPFAILGYTWDRPHILSAGFNCAGKPERNLLWLDCPVKSGNSGGPVLGKTPQGWRVTAVVSATNGRATLAAPVNDFLTP